MCGKAKFSCPTDARTAQGILDAKHSCNLHCIQKNVHKELTNMKMEESGDMNDCICPGASGSKDWRAQLVSSNSAIFK
eukprot:18788-Heterococcus_DN1.PRE.1